MSIKPLGGALQKEYARLPSRNDYPSQKEWEVAAWQKLIKSMMLLEPLITVDERRTITKRAAAVKALSAGKSYRQIGRELWLSPQTVSALKKAIGKETYRSYSERSKTERKKKQYSPGHYPAASRHKGKPHHTKYGTISLPH